MINILVSSVSRDFGGVESLFLALCKKRTFFDLRFDFICTDQSAAREEEFVEVGAKVFHLPRPGKDFLRYRSELKKIIKDGNYDILHVNLTRFRFPAEMIIAKSMGLKVILHSHAIQIYKTGSLQRDEIRKIEQVCFRPFALATSNLNLACCEAAGRYLYGSKPYKVIYNGIEIDKFRFDETARREIRDEFEIAPDEKVLGHIGRFAEEKNHEFLLKIFKSVNKNNPKTRLLCVGSGNLFESIVEQAIQLGLEDKVIFTGQRKDTAALLSAMDVFVFPSKHEAFPMTLIEAQSNGLPCIVSNKVTKEIDVDNSMSFYGIEANDISKWTRRIERTNRMWNRKEINQIEKFSVDAMIGQLKQLYRECL